MNGKTAMSLATVLGLVVGSICQAGPHRPKPPQAHPPKVANTPPPVKNNPVFKNNPEIKQTKANIAADKKTIAQARRDTYTNPQNAAANRQTIQGARQDLKTQKQNLQQEKKAAIDDWRSQWQTAPATTP